MRTASELLAGFVFVALLAACGPAAPPDSPKGLPIAAQKAPPPRPPASAPAVAPAPASSADGASRPPATDETDVALLPAGTSAGYFVSRAPLGPAGGREVVLVARDSETDAAEAEVVLAIVQGQEVLSRQEGIAAIAGEDALAKAALGHCERVETRARRIVLAKDVDGLRLSFLCARGEDYFSSKELAIVIRLGANMPADVRDLERIWSGVGDEVDVAMDACEKSSLVTFALLDARTLEKRVLARANWYAEVGAKMDPGFAANVQAGCKVTGKKQRNERIRLSSGG